MAPEAAPPPAQTLPSRARTLTQPSPIEGEGFSRAPQASGAIGRARHLRQRMTAAERRLWAKVRILDARFRRQSPLGRYVVDFVCHPARLIVELDGLSHDLEERQLHDAVRTAWLESQGYQVLRFRNDQMFTEPELVLTTIDAALKGHAS